MSPGPISCAAPGRELPVFPTRAQPSLCPPRHRRVLAAGTAKTGKHRAPCGAAWYTETLPDRRTRSSHALSQREFPADTPGEWSRPVRRRQPGPQPSGPAAAPGSSCGSAERSRTCSRCLLEQSKAETVQECW